MQFRTITGNGVGLAVASYSSGDAIGDNPTNYPGRILTLWADSGGGGLRAGLFDHQGFVYDSFGLHDFVLSYVSGFYSVSVDGSSLIQNVESSVRANAIWIGNPFFAFVIQNWSSVSLSLVKVTVPSKSSTPGSGPPGTKVLVQGSGFPSQQTGSPQILMSFDDQFLGFATNLSSGKFNFTFSVPLSQAGSHIIQAADLASGIKATTGFQVNAVTPAPSLSVTLGVGAIYFPGETAVGSILVTSTVSPAGPSGVTIQETLTRPDNSAVKLNATSLAPGVYRVSYPVPKTASIGTYSLVVVAHTSGAIDGTALVAFEVTQSWLAALGPAITVGATSTVGVLGAVAVVWKKGLIRHFGRNQAKSAKLSEVR